MIGFQPYIDHPYRSPSPQPPLPAVERWPDGKKKPVYIDVYRYTRQHYTSGDTIRGKVRVEPHFRPLSVTISLSGHAETQFKSSGQAQPLFTRTLELFSSSDHNSPSDALAQFQTSQYFPVELPFQFVFPHHVENPPGCRLVPKAEFEDHPGHALPPSYTYIPAGPMATSKRLVVYHLEAWYSYGSVDGPERRYHRHYIDFWPPAPTDNTPQTTYLENTPTHEHIVLVRSTKLVPSSNLFTKMKKVTSIDTPFYQCRLDVRCPTTLVAGMHLPLSLHFTDVRHTDGVTNPPPIYLRSVTVELTSMLHIRFPYKEGVSPADSYQRQKIQRKLLDWSYLEGYTKNIMVYDGWKLSELGDETMLKRDIIPGFRTYALNLEYQDINIELSVECMKETFKMPAYISKVQVVSNVVSDATAESKVADLPRYEGLETDTTDLAHTPPAYRA